MPERQLQAVLEKIQYEPQACDLEFLLAEKTKEQTEQIMRFADEVRSKFVGDGIVLRGIVEFSNYCRNGCAYCGLNNCNTALPRYRLTKQQVLESVEEIARAGIKTVVLQSGEDPDMDPDWLAGIIENIKTRFDMAVTLSVGEYGCEEYRLWKQAGADRYLLKIETTNAKLYGRLHPGMSLENRLRCLRDLRVLGYQTGSGGIVGLKGQACADLASDVLFFKKENFDMLGIGPFIPHPETKLADEPTGGLELTLRMLAITRIVTGDTHMPATTSVGVAGGPEVLRAALAAGANVIMPNFTPFAYKNLYQIYSGRDTNGSSIENKIEELENIAESLGRYLSFSRADSLKKNLLPQQVLVNQN